MGRITKITKHQPVSNFENLPQELVLEVVARVAADSFTDMFNAKLSCKRLNEISEDIYVYHHISLDKFSVTPWKPLTEKQQAFLNRCRECQNPELFYRQALVDLFNKIDVESGCENLQKAMNLGHLGAVYVTCLIQILSDDDESKSIGIELMANLKKSSFLRRKLALCRNNLINLLKDMWVKNPILKYPPTCCTTQHKRHCMNRWSDDEEEEDISCKGCSADREISLICERVS